MRTTLMLVVLMVCSLKVGCGTHAQSVIADGNWWMTLTTDQRATFITGFREGTILGGDFSHWGLDAEGNKKCSADAFQSFHNYSDKYPVWTLDPGQLADSLTNFYSDDRNRDLHVHDALWLEVNVLAGKPKEDVDKMIETFRRNEAARRKTFTPR